MNTATIESRQEIVAVLNSLNKRIDSEKIDLNSKYGKARLAIYMSLRDYYLCKLSFLSE